MCGWLKWCLCVCAVCRPLPSLAPGLHPPRRLFRELPVTPGLALLRVVRGGSLNGGQSLFACAEANPPADVPETSGSKGGVSLRAGRLCLCVGGGPAVARSLWGGLAGACCFLCCARSRGVSPWDGRLPPVVGRVPCSRSLFVWGWLARAALAQLCCTGPLSSLLCLLEIVCVCVCV